MLSTLKFIAEHPLNRRRPIAAIARYGAWQVGSRLVSEHVHSWIAGTKLLVRNGMTGATGNIYCGLHEFADMAFVLHTLQPGDTFLDVGANVGSYTVLASGVCGARSIAFEPDPTTAAHLRRNIQLNGLEHLTTVWEVTLGAHDGEASFTVGLDTMNRVVNPGEHAQRRVPMRKLDGIPGAAEATLMKLDVEGYEAEVLAGAGAVLASPSLLALETEAQGEEVVGLIEGAGFRRCYYNPTERSLGATPINGLISANALFVRDVALIQERVRSAPRRAVNRETI